MKLAGIALAFVMTTTLAACAAPTARTSFLGSVDLVEMTDRLAESFAADPVMATRTGDEQRWVVSIFRVVNRTNQIIPDREKWLYVARLRSRLAESDVATRYNLVWIIPPERWTIVAEELGGPAEPFGLRLPPTHLLAATFDALTTSSGRGRSDYYLCAYELVDLTDGHVVWGDAWEVKHAIAGRTYD